MRFCINGKKGQHKENWADVGCVVMVTGPGCHGGFPGTQLSPLLLVIVVYSGCGQWDQALHTVQETDFHEASLWEQHVLHIIQAIWHSPTCAWLAGCGPRSHPRSLSPWCRPWRITVPPAYKWVPEKTRLIWPSATRASYLHTRVMGPA